MCADIADLCLDARMRCGQICAGVFLGVVGHCAAHRVVGGDAEMDDFFVRLVFVAGAGAVWIECGAGLVVPGEAVLVVVCDGPHHVGLLF